MAQYRSTKNITVGSEPPQSVWTVVRGDTASFKVYAEDDSKNPLVINDWTIKMDFYRPSTDSVILEINPAADEDDLDGEFTVFLAYDETEILETDDIFDIQLSLPGNSVVWTILQGKIKMIEDITD